jgi:hypothetical protein
MLCSPNPTLQCTFSLLQCTLLSILCTFSILQCTLLSILCTLFHSSVRCCQSCARSDNYSAHFRYYVHPHSFVGWIKNFIHNRSKPTENMMRGYSRVTISRGAPTDLRTRLHQRYEDMKRELPSGSYLSHASKKYKRRGLGAGTRTLEVQYTRRLSKNLTWKVLKKMVNFCGMLNKALRYA